MGRKMAKFNTWIYRSQYTYYLASQYTYYLEFGANIWKTFFPLVYYVFLLKSYLYSTLFFAEFASFITLIQTHFKLSVPMR